MEPIIQLFILDHSKKTLFIHGLMVVRFWC